MSEYRVALRHTTLLESAALEAKGDDRYFIATAAPPPTHSILTLDEPGGGDGERKFFLVDKVIEVESDEQVCGVVGTLADAQAHEDASMMGTEHLEDGEAPPEDLAMAMPAPVVDPDLDDDEPEAAERERLEADVEGTEETEEEPTDSSAEGETDGTPKRGRKRRKRR